ncbi:SpoIIE family protein phosphatase [Streptomyces sp. NPDC004609]|uniref:SpoIIE family protein phosphatase n=1 Tax=Streptomyces sp. NPDC004609 TaxID=3364704 RepID=UPI0036AAE73C
MLRPDGSISSLEATANLPLGVTTQRAYQWREHTLEPGSVLMLYSSGRAAPATRPTMGPWLSAGRRRRRR